MALGTFETVIYLMALFVKQCGMYLYMYQIINICQHKSILVFYVTFIDDITFYMFIILFVCLYSIKIVFMNKRDALNICIL